MNPRRDITNDRGKEHGRLPRRSILSHVLFAVNIPLLAFVGIFLVYDYRREINERVESKRIALEEEAKTLRPAVLQLRPHGTAILQHYLDTVCGAMQTAESPGHHIAVRLPGITLQAAPHQRTSPQMLSALELGAKSPTHRAPWKGAELLVGIAEGDGPTVFVAESLQNVRRAVGAGVTRRPTGLIIMSLIAASIVNLVLLRTVTQPVGKLIQTVQQIAIGRFGVRSESFHNAELDYLAEEINRMSTSLAAADRDRQAQMAKAREIQQHLLPKPIEITGLNTAFLFHPAEDIGGDYYDVVRGSDGAWQFCVADVTGHGVPAAMSAAMLKMLLMQACERSSSPTEIAHFVNRRFLSASLDGDFVSMLVVRAVPGTQYFEYASAGHEPAWLLFPNGSLRELASTGLLSGIQEDAACDSATIEPPTWRVYS